MRVSTSENDYTHQKCGHLHFFKCRHTIKIYDLIKSVFKCTIKSCGLIVFKSDSIKPHDIKECSHKKKWGRPHYSMAIN